MSIAEELAAETWSVAPYARDELAMYILSGPHRVLRNVNLEDDEMRAVAALPELLALALAVVRCDETIVEQAEHALAKAGAA